MVKYFTLLEIREFLKNNYLDLFNKYENLTLLYPLKIKENLYELKGNIDFKLEKKKSNLIVNKNIEYNDIIIPISDGNTFIPLSNETSLNNIKVGDRIRNKVTSYKSGSVGFVFQIRDTESFFLVTNQHVIGRNYKDNDIIQKIISKKDHPTKYRNIGTYYDGVVSSYLDLAIVELTEEFNPTENDEVFITQNIIDCQRIFINNITQNIVSTYAYVKTSKKNSDFYDPPIILKEQIITNYKMFRGDSGSLAINSSNEAIGLLFAKNTKFSVLNNINNVIKYICHKLNIKKENIKIINQFNT
ncbi:MAG: hypothetical protein ABJH82_05600 [Polaribacter sp.]|uniref:hypothetical protein n=1 Tax=Polaribacter sp. TaxID=1920175 RepID=UPI00326478EB